MIYEKLSPALAALVFEYLRFPEATMASVRGTRLQPLYFSAENKLQTILEIYCSSELVVENTEIIKINSAGDKIISGQFDLDDLDALSERNDIQYISCPMSSEWANKSPEINTGKNISVAPNRFAPARIAFVVPSNSQPDSPQEVVLSGWFDDIGNCEITILSPGGGTTRSIQAEVISENPTRFGNYHSSQAFLTKPKLALNGKQEFFINMRPIAPHQFVTGGTWRLTVVNVGEKEINLNLKTMVYGNAKEVVFI